MMSLAPELAAWRARHHLSAAAVEEVVQLLLMAVDAAQVRQQCPGCGGRRCLRIRTGEPAP